MLRTYLKAVKGAFLKNSDGVLMHTEKYLQIVRVLLVLLGCLGNPVGPVKRRDGRSLM